MAVALVTGGAGFMGSHLVEELSQLSKEYKLIRVLDLAEFPRAQLALGAVPVEAQRGSITDAAVVEAAVQGVDVVFHAAALVDWGKVPQQRLFEVNVLGTRNVIQACVKHRVGRLVYTSTMDVVCWRKYETIAARDDELAVPPTAADFLYGHYATTKAQAEKEVAAANGKDGLHTVILRATGMFGERDPHHLPNVMSAARAGQLIVRMGGPHIVFQHCYVKNVAHAHVCAARALIKKAKKIGSKAYVIVDAPASNFWDFFADFVRAAGIWYPPAWLYLPRWLAMFIAYTMVLIAAILRPIVHWEPLMTPGAIIGVLSSHGFAGDRAGPELDYAPIIDHEEGRQRTLKAFIASLAAEQQPGALHKKRA